MVMKLILFSFLVGISLAAPAQNRMMSLEEAIATTLQNNYDIRIAANDSLAAAIDYEYRNAAFLPRLNANAGASWTTNDSKQVLADGTKRERSGLKSNNLTAQLALNWTLFDGLKMFATRDKLDEYLSLGSLTIKNQVGNTVAAVISTYYDIVRQKQQLKAIEEQISINQERVKLAQYKLDIGVGAKPDVLQSKVDLNEQKALQLEQLSTIARLKEQLNQLMNVKDANTLYEVADSIPINTGLSLGDIQNDALNNNPALLIAKKNIDIAHLTLKEAKADRWPTVSFNSAYNINRTNNAAVINSFSTLFNRNKGLNYGFTASIPIFNNYTVKRQIRQAELNIRYQGLLLDNQRSQVSLSVVNAYLDYDRQKKELALEEENILLARENVNIVLEVYRLNSTTLIQLKEAQKSLQDAYTRLITARYNAKQAETELLRLKGQLVQ